MKTDNLNELLSRLPAGELKLVDDRIVVMGGTWATPSRQTVALIDRRRMKKETGEPGTEIIRALVEIANLARAAQAPQGVSGAPATA